MCRDHQKKTTKKEDRDEQRGVPNVLPYEALKALVKIFKNIFSNYFYKNLKS